MQLHILGSSFKILLAVKFSLAREKQTLYGNKITGCKITSPIESHTHKKNSSRLIPHLWSEGAKATEVLGYTKAAPVEFDIKATV